MRLTEIMGNQQPFGGVNVVVLGDLYQLPPVKADYIFHGRSSGSYLWRQLFTSFELTQNQRQRDDNAWTALLNSIRDGSGSDGQGNMDNAFQQLQRRLLVSAGGPVADQEFRDAPRLYPRTAQVQRHNAQRLAELAHTGAGRIVVQATHQMLNRDHSVTNNVPRAYLPTNSDDCGGLQGGKQLAVGARVMLRRNIMTADGLVNGAQGTITGFRWPDGQQQPGMAPAAVLVRFDDARVGRLHRAQQQRPAAAAEEEPEPIAAIEPVNSQFTHNGRQLMRRQFPLTLAWALTIHRVQGLSMDRAVINLDHRILLTARPAWP